MARFLKMTDVIYTLRKEYGLKPSPEMVADLSAHLRDRIAIWATKTRFGKLKKVQVWQPDEDELRARFGGRRAMLMCWTCRKRHGSVARTGGLCTQCANRGDVHLIAEKP